MNTLVGIIIFCVLVSLAVSVWNTNSKVNELSNKIDDLQLSINKINGDNPNPFFDHNSLSDIKKELDGLKSSKLTCSPDYGGGFVCSFPSY